MCVCAGAERGRRGGRRCSRGEGAAGGAGRAARGAAPRSPLRHRLPAVLVGRPRGAHARRAALYRVHNHFVCSAARPRRPSRSRASLGRAPPRHAPPSPTHRHDSAPPITTAPHVRRPQRPTPPPPLASRSARSPRFCDMETSTLAVMLLLLLTPLLAAADWQENVRPKMFVQLGRKTYTPPLPRPDFLSASPLPPPEFSQ